MHKMSVRNLGVIPRRHTTSYRRWNDVVCLQVSSYLFIKKDSFLDAVSLKKSNLQSRIEI